MIKWIRITLTIFIIVTSLSFFAHWVSTPAKGEVISYLKPDRIIGDVRCVAYLMGEEDPIGKRPLPVVLIVDRTTMQKLADTRLPQYQGAMIVGLFSPTSVGSSIIYTDPMLRSYPHELGHYVLWANGKDYKHNMRHWSGEADIKIMKAERGWPQHCPSK